MRFVLRPRAIRGSYGVFVRGGLWRRKWLLVSTAAAAAAAAWGEHVVAASSRGACEHVGSSGLLFGLNY